MVEITAGGGAALSASSVAPQDEPSSAAFDDSLSTRDGSSGSTSGASSASSGAAGTSLPDGSGGDSDGDDAATTASAAAEAVVPGISAATTAARTAIESTWTAYETVTNTADEIEKLNSDGDQVVLSATLEGKGKIGVGAKGRYGYDITVQQVGNSQTPGVADDANVQYEVSFSKNLLAGASFEPPVPYIDVEAELNFHSADTVTMRFETREEAAEAARILQRTALAETVRDAGSLAASAASPLPGGDVTSNPGANPLTEDGTSSTSPLPTDPISAAGSVPSELAADALGPTPEELAFLQDNIVSYSTTLGVQERNKFRASLPAVLGYELRVDPNAEVTRTVTLPHDGQPGQLSYSIAGEVVASSKEKLTIGPKLFEEFYAGYVAQNVVDHGSARRELTLSWDIAPEAFERAPTVSGRPAPEAGLLSSGQLGRPDEAKLEITTQHQVQGLTDLSRTDMHRGTYTVTLANPDARDAQYLTEMMTRLPLVGDLPTPPVDADITFEGARVDRTGVRQEHELGFEVFDVKGLKANLILDIGRDDVSPLGLQPTPGPTDPAPTLDDNQLVVTPRIGLNLRGTPSVEGERVSVFQNGTFLQDSGERVTDAQGQEWAKVSGPDVNDQMVEGWVPTAYVEPHPEGAMDDTGRINPDLEEQGYREHLVTADDNLWDLAKQYGVDFQNMVMLNDDHLIDPSLIFAGDTVYIPGTANPPAPPPVVDTTPPVAPSMPPTESTGAGGPYMPIPGSDSPPPTTVPSAPSASAPSTPPATGSSSGSPSASSSSTPSAAPDPVTPTLPAAPAAPGDRQAELDRIRREYQVVDDTMVDYTPNFGPFPIDIPFVGSAEMTQREAAALDDLGRRRGLLGLQEFRSIASNDPENLGQAYTTADRYFPRFDAAGDPIPGGDDGHNDAFRHAYLNALLTDRFGEDFAETFATAHEGVPGNPADREAMDLYNNEVGRRIAMENPGASDEELADLVYQAVINGEAIVINVNGELAFSDQVEVGQTGRARRETIEGVITPPDPTTSN